MRFPTMWYVGLAKPQSICELLEYSMSDKLLTKHGVSKLKRRVHRLV